MNLLLILLFFPYLIYCLECRNAILSRNDDNEEFCLGFIKIDKERKILFTTVKELLKGAEMISAPADLEGIVVSNEDISTEIKSIYNPGRGEYEQNIRTVDSDINIIPKQENIFSNKEEKLKKVVSKRNIEEFLFGAEMLEEQNIFYNSKEYKNNLLNNSIPKNIRAEIYFTPSKKVYHHDLEYNYTEDNEIYVTYSDYFYNIYSTFYNNKFIGSTKNKKSYLKLSTKISNNNNSNNIILIMKSTFFYKALDVNLDSMKLVLDSDNSNYVVDLGLSCKINTNVTGVYDPYIGIYRTSNCVIAGFSLGVALSNYIKEPYNVDNSNYEVLFIRNLHSLRCDRDVKICTINSSFTGDIFIPSSISFQNYYSEIVTLKELFIKADSVTFSNNVQNDEKYTVLIEGRLYLNAELRISINSPAGIFELNSELKIQGYYTSDRCSIVTSEQKNSKHSYIKNIYSDGIVPYCCSGNKYYSLNCNDYDRRTFSKINRFGTEWFCEFPTSCDNIPVGLSGGKVYIWAETIKIGKNGFMDLSGTAGKCKFAQEANEEPMCSGSGSGGIVYFYASDLYVEKKEKDVSKISEFNRCVDDKHKYFYIDLSGGGYECNENVDTSVYASCGNGGKIFYSKYRKYYNENINYYVDIKDYVYLAGGKFYNNEKILLREKAIGVNGTFSIQTNSEFTYYDCAGDNCVEKKRPYYYIYYTTIPLCSLSIAYLISRGIYLLTIYLKRKNVNKTKYKVVTVSKKMTLAELYITNSGNINEEEDFYKVIISMAKQYNIQILNNDQLETMNSEEIFSGGQGVTYKTTDQNNVVYCTKVIKRIKIDEKQEYKLINKTIISELASLLMFQTCKFTPKVYNIFASSSVFMMNIEWCDGGQLDKIAYKLFDLLKKDIISRKTYEFCIVHWGRQLCSALIQIHKENIIHRDIKPGNILLSTQLKLPHDNSQKLTLATIKKSEIRLVDFGISRMYKENLATIKQQSFSYTPLYSPPEVLSKGKYSPQSDIFSLGTTLCTLLNGGIHPLQNENDKMSIIMSTSMPIIPNKKYPFMKFNNIELNNLFLSMWRQNPMQRPGANECMEVLTNIYTKLNNELEKKDQGHKIKLGIPITEDKTE